METDLIMGPPITNMSENGHIVILFGRRWYPAGEKSAALLPLVDRNVVGGINIVPQSSLLIVFQL